MVLTETCTFSNSLLVCIKLVIDCSVMKTWVQMVLSNGSPKAGPVSSVCAWVNPCVRYVCELFCLLRVCADLCLLCVWADLCLLDVCKLISVSSVFVCWFPSVFASWSLLPLCVTWSRSSLCVCELIFVPSVYVSCSPHVASALHLGPLFLFITPFTASLLSALRFLLPSVSDNFSVFAFPVVHIACWDFGGALYFCMC